jgi:hypothetical protein
MNRFDKIALAVAIAVTLLCARGQMRIMHFYMQMDHLPKTIIPTWATGWVIATYGPMAIAAWIWRWAKRTRAPWLLHLLFLPCAIIALNVGESVMVSTIREPDFDGTLGGPMAPAILLFFIAVGGYFSGLILRQIRKAGDHPEVS